MEDEKKVLALVGNGYIVEKLKNEETSQSASSFSMINFHFQQF